MESTLEIFCCYARRDQSYLYYLQKHLAALEPHRGIKLWADTDIAPGSDWKSEIDKHLHSAKIILLLVSPDFMASEYCYSVEMKKAIERHEHGDAYVIPILLRPVSRQDFPLSELQMSPTNGVPIAMWPDRDKAFSFVAKDILQVIEQTRLLKNDQLEPGVGFLNPWTLSPLPNKSQTGKVNISYCYAHTDRPLADKLKSHLRPLERQGLTNAWYDRDISAGTDWEREIDQHLNTAQIILLLISPDFIKSDYCYGVEMRKALQRQEKGEAHIIPIILRRVSWEQTPIGRFQALPTNAHPVVSHYWHSQDEAYINVVQGIRRAVEQMLSDKETITQRESPALIPDKTLPLTASTKVSSDKTFANGLASLAVNFHQAIARLFLLVGLHQQALSTYEQAIALASSKGKLYVGKGNALYRLKQYEEALKAYEAAIQLNPSSSKPYEGKARVFEALAEQKYKQVMQEAFEAYKRAKVLNDDKGNQK